jgi:hypothetical protein
MPLLPRSRHSPLLSVCVSVCLHVSVHVSVVCVLVSRSAIVWLAWICRCVRVCLCLFPEGERAGFCDATAGYSTEAFLTTELTSEHTAGQAGKAKPNPGTLG